MIRVTWTGAAGLQFETGQQTILIDPYHTRVGILHTLTRVITPDEAAITTHLPDMKKIDAIIVSHTHSDHALDVPYIAGHCNCTVVGSASLNTLMELDALPDRVRICAGGETVPLGDTAAVTMVPSTHGLVALGKVPFPGEIGADSSLPMKASGYRVGTVFAPKLQIQGKCFLHVGSANFIDAEMTGHTCDVLFLCVPGWKKRQGYPLRLIERVQPQTVVLFHHDDFSKPHIKGTRTRSLPFTDIRGMVKTIERYFPGLRVMVPDVYDTLEF